MSGATVSAILVNYRGCEDTLVAIGSLYELDWPSDRLEIVVVDNASGDDSASRIRAAFPEVLLVQSETNVGFAGGCNLGVVKSSGQYVALLNNDARAEPRWISEAIHAMEQDDTIARPTSSTAA
jgi:GT2 family glycosyltransferase